MVAPSVVYKDIHTPFVPHSTAHAFISVLSGLFCMVTKSRKAKMEPISSLSGSFDANRSVTSGAPVLPPPPSPRSLASDSAEDEVTRRLLRRRVVGKNEVDANEPWAGCNWREALNRLEQYLCIVCGANRGDFTPLVDWNHGAFIYNQTASRTDTYNHCNEMLRVVRSAPSETQAGGGPTPILPAKPPSRRTSWTAIGPRSPQDHPRGHAATNHPR